ncbi:MAG: FdhF/YdeP family oxidoreductase [Phycisphaerales bacterium]
MQSKRRRQPRFGGGWPAIWYTLKQARAAGGLLRMWRALRAKNACKTCALGMGGQLGGMVNESGHFPEFCKKSVQAMAADMRGRIRDGFFEEFPFSKLAAFSPRELEAAGRITQPLYAGPNDRGYRAITWDEAIERTANAMRGAAPSDTFFYASGRSSNEAGFLFQLFARLYGTNNVHNCSFFCHNASGAALKTALGSSAGTLALEDLEHSDCIVLIGANPASNHPRLMRTLIDLKRRGGKVVVVNPMREIGLERFRVPSDPRSLLFGSTIADEYIQPHIGGDVAFLSGVAKALDERGAVDTAYVEQCTNGFDAWRDHLRATPWEALVEAAGVDERTMRRFAEVYAASRATVFAWTMGITHHEHGVANVHAIANLALMRGMIGRRGAGLLPLRGHSNIQGMGTVGVVPTPSPTFVSALESHYRVELPRDPGLDTLACLERAAQGGVRFAMHLGGNLFGSAPDAAWTARALEAIDFTVFLSTTLNTGHVHGRGKESLVLPVQARDEESQSTTQESMFSYVRLSEGGTPRFDGPRGETELLATIARRVLGERRGVDCDALASHDALRAAMAAAIPEMRAVADIGRTGKEFVVEGRRLNGQRFPTPTGRASFQPAPLPALSRIDAARGELRLMTVRSEGQFNTIVYEDEDWYRAQERRDVILMNRADMRAMGIEEDARVRVESEVGAMDGIVARGFDIRAGNAAMYYPEANALVPARVDPRSRTPMFKSVPIRVRASTSLPVIALKTAELR